MAGFPTEGVKKFESVSDSKNRADARERSAQHPLPARNTQSSTPACGAIAACARMLEEDHRPSSRFLPGSGLTAAHASKRIARLTVAPDDK